MAFIFFSDSSDLKSACSYLLEVKTLTQKYHYKNILL